MVDTKIIGIIPARFGSKRLPGKPLREILGKSLIQRTYENARQASSLKRLVVATDDERIYDHVLSFGGEAVMTSSTCLTGTDRIAEAVTRYFPTEELIVNIQGDEPCLDPKMIDLVVEALHEDQECPMATVAARLYEVAKVFDPSVVKCLFDQRGRALYFSRSPLPYNGTTFYRHLGLYAYRRSFLLRYAELAPTPLQQAEDLEQLKALEWGFPIALRVVEDSGMGVDTPEDLIEVERWLCQENISSSQEALSPR